MTADERGAVAQRVLERSRADATEVTVSADTSGLTRFTHQAVNQSIDSRNAAVRVRAIVGGRVGIAATNAFSAAALADVAARAYDIAVLAPVERITPTLAGDVDTSAPPGAFVAATAAATSTDRARIAGAIFEQSTDGLWSSGFTMTATTGVTIATSNGGRQSFDGTDAGVNVKMNGADSTGFAEAYSTDATTLDGTHVGLRAAQIARGSRAPLAVEPGDWTVIMAPAAVGELLRFLAAHFSAEAYTDGSSFITGKLGSPVLGPNVTLRDDFAHPLNPGMPFDAEGYPTRPITLVDRGVANAIVTDSTWSTRLGRPNTGHALPAPNSSGPQSTFTVLDAGTTSLEALIAATPRGLLITRLWYVRLVDQRTVLLTGMTRDGTFLIENGVVTRGVRNMRFNESIVAALNDCELGNMQLRTGSYHYSLVTPAVKFNRFHFASASPY